jgi:two-component system, OmpR family, phosphate regulon sensor histidine kinase PhoR
MHKRHILYFTIFGVIAIMSIFVVQIFWVKEAVDISHSQFDQTVNIALRDIAEKISSQKKSVLHNKSPVKKINSTFYIVQMNSDIDPKVLDYYIRTVFDYFNINEDVEYGIYSCYSDQLVYCNYIQKNKPLQVNLDPQLPKEKGLDYYFTVSFPHYKIVSLHNVPMWVATSIILFIAVLFFIYSLFIVYRQRDITQVQKDFINNMTHEFKTPISTISIIQQVISEPSIVNTPDRLQKYAGIIGVEASRLNELVEKVLNITRIEKGQFELTREVVHINDLIKSIAEQSAARYSLEFNALVDYNCAALQDVGSIDIIHFSNIIFNLVDNGIKYGGKPPEIHISTRNIGSKIIVEITDNGIGFEKKESNKIFDKFYRIPTGNIHNVKGFGLGLYYVKKIIDAHKFNIFVSSKVNQGTTFSIEMPFL